MPDTMLSAVQGSMWFIEFVTGHPEERTAMRTLCRSEGDHTFFVVTDLDDAYRAAARHLNFASVEEGVARGFPSASPHLDRIYETFAQRADDLLAQRAGVRPVPWERALESVIQRVEGQAINWWLVGSAALAVRGLAVTPGDVDLVVDDAGARQLGELLLDDLIEPVVPVEGWICNWFGRAFPGALVEWVGGVDERADQPRPSDFGPIAASQREAVHWRGHRLHVPPLDLQLTVSEARGRMEQAALIRAALGGASVKDLTP